MIELHSIPSEQIVLSTLMSLEQIADTLVDQVDISDFYAGRHQIIFSHIADQHKKGESLDAVTIFELIKINHQEKEVSEQYLIELNNRITTTLMFETHLAKLKDLSARRRLQDTSKLISAMAVDMATHTAETAVSKAQSLVQNLDLGVGEEKLKHAHEFSKVAISEFIHRHQALDAGVPFDGGIRTGFTELDNKLGEVGKGDLVIIGARPSMGKTTFAQNIMSDMAINQGMVVQFHSCEMTTDEIRDRIVSGVGQIRLSNIKGKCLEDDDWGRLMQANKMLEHSKFAIDDTANASLSDIRRKARLLKAKFGRVDAIFVDYLQIMKSPIVTDNQVKAIGEISKGLKAIAKEFDCVVFALSQLSRNLENRPNKRPVNADLRESGQIEQDADVILFIYRDEIYNKESKCYRDWETDRKSTRLNSSH